MPFILHPAFKAASCCCCCCQSSYGGGEGGVGVSPNFVLDAAEVFCIFCVGCAISTGGRKAWSEAAISFVVDVFATQPYLTDNNEHLEEDSTCGPRKYHPVFRGALEFLRVAHLTFQCFVIFLAFFVRYSGVLDAKRLALLAAQPLVFKSLYRINKQTNERSDRRSVNDGRGVCYRTLERKETTIFSLTRMKLHARRNFIRNLQTDETVNPNRHPSKLLMSTTRTPVSVETILNSPYEQFPQINAAQRTLSIRCMHSNCDVPQKTRIPLNASPPALVSDFQLCLALQRSSN